MINDLDAGVGRFGKSYYKNNFFIAMLILVNFGRSMGIFQELGYLVCSFYQFLAIWQGCSRRIKCSLLCSLGANNSSYIFFELVIEAYSCWKES